MATASSPSAAVEVVVVMVMVAAKLSDNEMHKSNEMCLRAHVNCVYLNVFSLLDDRIYMRIIRSFFSAVVIWSNKLRAANADEHNNSNSITLHRAIFYYLNQAMKEEKKTINSTLLRQMDTEWSITKRIVSLQSFVCKFWWSRN